MVIFVATAILFFHRNLDSLFKCALSGPVSHGRAQPWRKDEAFRNTYPSPHIIRAINLRNFRIEKYVKKLEKRV